MEDSANRDIQATPYTDINRLLEELLSQIGDVLQENLVGLYVYGSLTTGDFDRGSSDIDLLAATSSYLTDAEFEALRAMHRDFAHENPEWDDRVEVAYLSVTALATFRSEISPMAVISPGEPFHVKEAGKDWLLNWYVVRESGVPLAGPPAEAIIAPISQQEFVKSVSDYAVWWGDKIQDAREWKEQAYAILTMCRALHVRQNGEQVSKKQAATWAAQELPQWSRLIQQALIWRDGWRDEDVDHAATSPETVRFVQFVRDLILA
jgi:predicted nucleotidyltransferase